MSEPAIDHATMPAPLDTLIERAEARALLWPIGELTLHEAVDESALKVLETWGLLRGTSS
jgi:hypothetical protein